MCQAAIPKLREGGRIVNMSSVGCKLENYSKPNQDRFRKAYDGMTLDELEELVQEYETSFKKGTTKEDGWPFQKPYCVSKAAVTGKSPLRAVKHGCSSAFQLSLLSWLAKIQSSRSTAVVQASRSSRSPHTALTLWQAGSTLKWVA